MDEYNYHSDFARLKILVDDLEINLFKRKVTTENIQIAKQILSYSNNIELLHPAFLAKVLKRIENIERKK